ncbi:hypothetical protein Pcinc_019782 [Petrolisthes cinctipes]|uniref:Uncharacterized protein n=1 Tax=Petrolisthes cinctipes TaxID=88211 RepID=A0AAE1FKI8_PETCI|nr:hypothetical protein Pcinc_019782 [Petrolisthes cinctipes]
MNTHRNEQQQLLKDKTKLELTLRSVDWAITETKAQIEQLGKRFVHGVERNKELEKKLQICVCSTVYETMGRV